MYTRCMFKFAQHGVSYRDRAGKLLIGFGLRTVVMPAESTPGRKLAEQISLGAQRVVDLEEDRLCCSGWIFADLKLIRLGSRWHS